MIRLQWNLIQKLFMKTIGLLGGLSWQSTALYYRFINEEINHRLGKNHSARICMYSFDFQEIEYMQHQGLWESLCQKLIEAALILERSGAEILLICSNTMHRCFEEIKQSIDIPVVHIAQSSGKILSKLQIGCTGLIGTSFLVHSNIYTSLLKNQFDIEVLIPTNKQINLINAIIYSELVKGIIRDESKKQVLEAMDDLISRGAQSVILGCTEIPLMILQGDCSVPVIDTTYVHAVSAVDASLH